MKCAVAVLALTGCNAILGIENVPAPAIDGAFDTTFEPTCTSKSGSRLRVVQIAVEGISEDVELRDYGELCTFQLASDGTFRCFPQSTFGDFLAFIDEGCNSPIVASFPGSEPPPIRRFVSTEFSGGGGSQLYRCRADDPVRAFDLADQTPVSTTIYIRDRDRNCVPMSTPANYQFFVASEIPPSALAKAMPVRVGDGRIQISAFDGDDGSRWCEPQRRFDTMLANECETHRAGDDVERCVPTTAGDVVDVFVNDVCGTSVHASRHLTCEADNELAIDYTDGPSGCSTWRVRRRAEALQGFVVDDQARCIESPVYERFYRNAEVPPAEMVESIPTRVELDGRRLQREVEQLAGTIAPTGLWFDSNLDTYCSFHEGYQGSDRDTVRRCVPVHRVDAPLARNTTFFFFTDEVCSETTRFEAFTGVEANAGTGRWCDPGYDAPRFGQVWSSRGELEVHEVGNRIETPVYLRSQSSPSECFPANRDVWSIGPSLTGRLYSTPIVR